MNRDTAKDLVQHGANTLYEALAKGRSEELLSYLSVMSRFHHYSWGNQMLIWHQRPDATRIAGYRRWRELDRQVRKGERGIGILAPLRRKHADKDGEESAAIIGFRLAWVFDISQTDGEDLPEFQQATGAAGQNQARIEAVIRDAGILLVEDDDLPLDVSGVSQGGRITLRAGLEPAEKLRVSVHELAHELLGHPDRVRTTTNTQRETEAEAVAFVVTTALGIDGLRRSADYIHLHGGGVESFSDSLDVIQKTACHILSQMEAVELPCRHTLQLADGSSWVLDKDGKYVCSVCGRFYGYAQPEEDAPAVRVGRADYEERREARLQRLSEQAERAREDAEALSEEARRMADAIPLGQPILVGHHSEKRDRRYRERMHNKCLSSHETQKKAQRLEARRESAETNAAISSDDPEALRKLRDKLTSLEERQAYMKRLNAAWRKAGKPKSADLEAWHKVANLMGVSRDKIERMAQAMSGVDHFSNARDRAPCAPYELTNNNANIRRVRERISELEREGQLTEASEIDHGICRVVENVEINRIQVLFSEKPDDAVRNLLKKRGFRWSRHESAWQRQLNNSGRWAAKALVESLRGGTVTDRVKTVE